VLFIIIFGTLAFPVVTSLREGPVIVDRSSRLVSHCTKFEVSRFTRYEATTGSAKCRKWGGLGRLGALKFIGNVIIR